MAVRLMKVGNSFNVPQKTYIANDSTERDNINALFGDLCLVIEDGITYILNSEGEWYPYTIGGGGGGNANTDIIAPTYDPTLAYSQYQLIVYEGELYRATEAIAQPAGDFDETKWEKVDIASAKADLIDGKVPASQLPSYVDDVLEFNNRAAFPQEGERGIIYVAIDTGYTYRWTSTEYVAIGTLNTEVHIGPDQPTGEEVLWVKPEGLLQTSETVDDKSEGDWIYLDETWNGETVSVPYYIWKKDDQTSKAYLLRKCNYNPGYLIGELDFEETYNNITTLETEVMQIYNENVQNYASYYKFRSSEISNVGNPTLDFNNFYSSLRNDEDYKEIIIYSFKEGPIGIDERPYSITEVYWRDDMPSVYPQRTRNELVPQSLLEATNLYVNTYGYNRAYLGIALEMDLDAPLVGIDASVDPYSNYTLKFKKDNQWNDLDDIRLATRAQLTAAVGELQQSIGAVSSAVSALPVVQEDEGGLYIEVDDGEEEGGEE